MKVNRLPTGTPVDKILGGGLESGAIINLYGPAGSGKTNIALSAALCCKRPVVYMDTEGSFSPERFAQLGGNEKAMKNVIFIDAHSWDEQNKNVKKLERVTEKEGVGLIIIDSMVSLYRLALDEKNFHLANRQLATQYSILSKISRTKNIPILVTNQVYSVGDKIELTSRAIAKYWSKTLVELKRLQKDNQRLAVLRKHRSLPEGKSIEFKITSGGMEEVGKLGIF